MYNPATMPNRESSLKSCCLALMVAIVAVTAVRADQTIVVRSGNGSIGSQDAQVRFLAYGTTGDITPTPANFVSVQTAPFAYIVAPYATYLPQLPSDPLAKWIATNPSLNPGSALYAVPFEITDSVIASATLDLPYAVDNAINGVYINGTPISGDSHDGDYHSEYRFLRSDIAPLLHPNSTNWLYLNASDYGGLAALIFSATITTHGATAGAPTISPDHGGNTGITTVTVIGSGFQSGTQLTLTGIGSDITGTNTTVVTPNILTATLDLNNAQSGLRSVIIVNPNAPPVTVPGGFMVNQGGAADIRIQKIGTPPVPGYTSTYYITVTNAGNIDSSTVPIAEYLEPWFTNVSYSRSPTYVGQAPALFPASAAGTTYTAFLEWDLPTVAAGDTQVLTYRATVDRTFPGGLDTHGTACEAAADLLKGCATLETACMAAAVTTCLAGPECIGFIETCELGVKVCVATAGGICVIDLLQSRSSRDPNDLIGPPGVGNQRWIRGNQPLQYALSFENLPTATKSATNVVVTTVFDASTLDITTVAVRSVTIGNSVFDLPNLPLAINPFSTDVDLRPGQNLIVRVTGALNSSTNQATVQFLSIDPATGLPPTDPLVGFLPPGAGGTVFFAVAPKAGLATGTAIQDTGTVVFDLNTAINTPSWLNTIDNSLPVSMVLPLASTQTCPNFRVSWSGSDVGSGLMGFTVYASDTGGPFAPWLTNTTAAAAIFTGVVGHTYSFYSIGTDLTGNMEVGKTSAEASTAVTAASSCGGPSLNGKISNVLQSGTTVTLNLQLTNTGFTAAQAVNINQVTFRTLSGSGTVTLGGPMLPAAEGPLGIGASTSVPLTLNVPATVTRFSITESGNMKDGAGNAYNYSVAQTVIP
jgi:hypothetical protein